MQTPLEQRSLVDLRNARGALGDLLSEVRRRQDLSTLSATKDQALEFWSDVYLEVQNPRPVRLVLDQLARMPHVGLSVVRPQSSSGTHCVGRSRSGMERRHPRSVVLDNERFETSSGDVIKPDVVVVDSKGVHQVREAKDVAELRSSHVWQTIGYDQQLRPRAGSTIDIVERTRVPDHVAELAELFDIKIKRWDN